MNHPSVMFDSGPVERTLIEEFEQSLGVVFPADYKNLLSKHNAAYLEKNVFKYVVDENQFDNAFEFFGYGDVEAYKAIRSLQQVEHIVDRVVVVGSTADGDYVAFDYRDDRVEPFISLFFHDEFDDNGKMKSIKLSENYTKFVGDLESDIQDS